MLKKLFDGLKKENLKSGFSATGLHPLNRDMISKRIPRFNQDLDDETTETVLNNSVMSLLRKHCGIDGTNQQRGRNCRGKKIAPGQVITPASLSIYRQLQILLLPL